jgi:hypothetical protein
MNRVNIKSDQQREPFKPQAVRLLDQVREVLRYHHYALKTEKAYVGWIKQFVLFSDKRHPREMGKKDSRHGHPLIRASSESQPLEGRSYE